MVFSSSRQFNKNSCHLWTSRWNCFSCMFCTRSRSLLFCSFPTKCPHIGGSYFGSLTLPRLLKIGPMFFLTNLFTGDYMGPLPWLWDLGMLPGYIPQAPGFGDIWTPKTLPKRPSEQVFGRLGKLGSFFVHLVSHQTFVQGATSGGFFGKLLVTVKQVGMTSIVHRENGGTLGLKGP